MKLGMSVTPRACDNVGHGDETRALIQYLNKEHEVCVLGRFGSPLDIEGVETIEQEYITSLPNENQEACIAEYERLAEAAKEFAPHVTVTIIGPCGSACVPGRSSLVQAFAANYDAPVMYVWRALKEVPRVCTLNDPRNIIRLKEARDWDVWPQAILSQCNEQVDFTVHGQRIQRIYRYHRTQNWGLSKGYAVDISGWEDRHDVGILAHTHEVDGRLSRNRRDVWDWILAHCGDVWDARGRGWPEGPMPAGEVPNWLRQYKCGPMIPISEGWVTAKFGQYARSGCVPRPYDAGGYLTYDKYGLMIPLHSELRWNPGTDRLVPDSDEAVTWLNEAMRLTQPDFTSLDDVLSEAYHGNLPMWETFGGYRVH
jgi:hypothetical protein